MPSTQKPSFFSFLATPLGTQDLSSPPGTEPVPPEVEALKEVNVLVAQSCQTLCDPLDCSPPGSSVHGVLQARILEWVAISFSRGYSRSRDVTCISCIGRRILYHRATWEAPLGSMYQYNDVHRKSSDRHICRRLTLFQAPVKC